MKFFTLDNLSKYGHFTSKLVGRYFYWSKKEGGGKLTPEPHKKYVSTTEKVDKNKPE